MGFGYVVNLVTTNLFVHIFGYLGTGIWIRTEHVYFLFDSN